MKIFVSIYNPVDLFPPTINAIEQFAAKGYSIILLTNGLAEDKKWVFPENVSVNYNENWSDTNRKTGLISNLMCFTKYYFRFKKIMRSQTFDLVILYEPHAALAYKLLFKLKKTKTHLLWYHNHDIYELSRLKKYSLGWFAAKAEQKIFPSLSIFTLPANERKAYFPIQQLKGQYFFIPNYPSVKLYSQYKNQKLLNDEIRILYQGKISSGHGLEELLGLMPDKINNKIITLHLKGPVDEGFIAKLTLAAVELGVMEQVFFYGLSTYLKVPELAVTCHIGIGIHTNTDIMHTTLGTSSNKIYEYAAAGLPVLLYDNKHFKEHLDKYPWAFFTDCSKDSLTACIEAVTNNFQPISGQANKDFLYELNFENYFNPVMEYVSGKINN